MAVQKTPGAGTLMLKKGNGEELARVGEDYGLRPLWTKGIKFQRFEMERMMLSCGLSTFINIK